MNPILKQFHDNELLRATVEQYLVGFAETAAVKALRADDPAALHLSTAIKTIEGAFARLREECGATATPITISTR